MCARVFCRTVYCIILSFLVNTSNINTTAAKGKGLRSIERELEEYGKGFVAWVDLEKK